MHQSHLGHFHLRTVSQMTDFPPPSLSDMNPDHSPERPLKTLSELYSTAEHTPLLDMVLRETGMKYRMIPYRWSDVLERIKRIEDDQRRRTERLDAYMEFDTTGPPIPAMASTSKIPSDPAMANLPSSETPERIHGPDIMNHRDNSSEVVQLDSGDDNVFCLGSAGPFNLTLKGERKSDLSYIIST